MKFSIIIPAYNAQKTIADTIQSILEQKTTPEYDFEIIIVDDGSSDDTLKVCEYFLQFHKNIEVYTQANNGLTKARNQGASKARNQGASKARGEILLFLDSDDMLPPNTLWHYYLVFSNYEVDFVAGLMGIFYEPYSPMQISINKGYLKQQIGYVDLSDKQKGLNIFNHAMSACTKAYKKEFLSKHNIAFLDFHHLCEDHLWTLTCVKHAKACFCLPLCVLHYRQHHFCSVQNFKLNYLEDMIAVQKGILKLGFKDLSPYYERFLKNFDYKKHLIEQCVLGQDKPQLKASVKGLKELLEIIPWEMQKKFIPKNFIFPNRSERGIYRRMLRIRANRRLKKTYKKLKSPFIKPLKRFINTLNGLWYRRLLKKYQCRHKFLKALYQIFSYLPITKAKVSFGECIYGMKYLGDIKEILQKDSNLVIKTIPYTVTLSDDIKRMYHFAKSSIILIDNYYQPLFGITPRKETSILQCWHAGGLFKKFGYDSAVKGSKEYQYETKIHQSYSYAFVSGQKAIAGYMSAFNLKNEQILPLGNITTDILIKNQISQQEAKVILGINPHKKLIVYAPTFRDWERPHSNLNLDFQPFIEKYADKYEFAIRIHPTTKPIINQQGIHNLSLKEEWLVLNAADALITDYSSIIFTYAYFGRPIYFYPYDYPKYIGQKGFYEDYFHFIPGEVAFNEEELLKLLEYIPPISTKTQQLWQDYMGECDGNTAQKIANFIKDKIGFPAIDKL